MTLYFLILRFETLTHNNVTLPLYPFAGEPFTSNSALPILIFFQDSSSNGTEVFITIFGLNQSSSFSKEVGLVILSLDPEHIASSGDFICRFRSSTEFVIFRIFIF